jgi:hypothetical protein
MNSSHEDIIACISAIRGERNVEKRMRMLQDLNESLPSAIRLEMPSLITNAYVRRALDIIEDKTILMSSKGIAHTQA